MPIIQTAKELGLAIRSRRKELGWDQATLAKQVGVTRQWVIDIEKGKPRAELALAIRALRVLGLSLTVEANPQDADSRSSSGGKQRVGAETPTLDIDSIVERNRGFTANQLAAIAQLQPKVAADYLKELDAASQLASLSAAKDASGLLNGARSIDHLAELVAPKLPKTAVDYLKEIEALRSLDPMTHSAAAKASAPLLEGTASINRLADPAAPKLPKTAADYLEEIEALQSLDSLTHSATAKASVRLLEDAASINRLANLAAPKLPGAVADHLKEIEALRRFDRPARVSVKRPADAESSDETGQPARISKRAAKKPTKGKVTPKGSRQRKR